MISAAETHCGTFNFSESHPRRLAIIMLISRPGSRIAPRPTHPNAVDKVATNILRSPEPSHDEEQSYNFERPRFHLLVFFSSFPTSSLRWRWRWRWRRNDSSHRRIYRLLVPRNQ